MALAIEVTFIRAGEGKMLDPAVTRLSSADAPFS